VIDPVTEPTHTVVVRAEATDTDSIEAFADVVATGTSAERAA
jgi:hypothetical protein